MKEKTFLIMRDRVI